MLQDSAFIVDDSGHVTSFGGQIAFPAAQVASADVNVLDDYQEGTFTPTLTGSVVPTYTGGTLLGRYVKIGNHVFASVWITGVTITGSGGGQARIGGFPFSAAATNVHTSSVDVATAAAFSVLPTALYMRGGAAVASLIDVALTAPTWNVVAGVNVCFQVFYMI